MIWREVQQEENGPTDLVVTLNFEEMAKLLAAHEVIERLRIELAKGRGDGFESEDDAGTLDETLQLLGLVENYSESGWFHHVVKPAPPQTREACAEAGEAVREEMRRNEKENMHHGVKG